LKNPADNFYQWGSWNELDTAGFASSVVKIHYGPHPRYGEEAEVFLSYKCGEETFYLISLFDNSRVLIPAWMTDENACRCCVFCDSPVCLLEMLRQLRQVLDALAT